MSIRITLIGIAILLLSSSIFSQEEKDKTNVQVIDFGGDDDAEADSYSGLIIKTSPLSFLIGNQTIELEKELSDFVSVQGGIGLTFRNYVASIFGDSENLEIEGFGYIFENCDSENWEIDYCDNYAPSDYRMIKAGPRLTASLRLFFDSDGFEGLYFSPSITYARHNAEVQLVKVQPDELERQENNTVKEFENHTDLTVRLGTQQLGDKLASDLFVGLGLRLRTGERLDVGQDENRIYGNATREINQTSIRLELGVRIGLQL